MSKRGFAALRHVGYELLENRMLMATDTWTGLGANTNFSTAGNWQGSVAPQSGDNIVFPLVTAKLVNIDSSVTVGSISIGAVGYQITGAKITFSGGLSSSATSEIDANLTLGLAESINVTGGTLKLAGTIDDAGHALGITKTGTGILNITGSGTYTGNTAVSAGTLQLDGTIASKVALTTGATLDGNGTAGGITSSGATILPGAAYTAGQISDTAGLTLNSSTTFSMLIDGNQPGSGAGFYSHVSTGGNVALNGAALSISIGPDYTPASGDVITLISNAGTATNGSFAGLPQGSLLTLTGGSVFRLSYTGGTGHHDTTLTFVRVSAVTLSSSAPTAITGQSVIFSAVVTAIDGQPGTPTGTVTFYDNGVAIGSAATLNGNAQASITDTSLTQGSHTITATYSGDTAFQSATSAGMTQTVNAPAAIPTTTTLTPSTGNGSVWGQNVTFTASVIPDSAGTGAVTGTVQFYVDGIALGAAQPLVSGTATASTSTMGVGTHSVTATFTSSNSSYNGGNSVPLAMVVSQSNTATTLTSSSLNSVTKQSITFTATVTPTGNGAGVLTGVITFEDNGVQIGTGAVNSAGVATYSTSSLTAGTHLITAVYSGDTHFISSTSTAISQVVTLSPTQILLTSSAATSVFGQTVILTASVSPLAGGNGTPTGSVEFTIDGVLAGTASLASGQASFSIATLSVGTHSITVSYEGDSNYAVSTSGTVTQVVNKSATMALVTDSFATSGFGQSTTFIATVSTAGNGVGIPTGTVVFMDGSTVLATQTLDGGSATYSTTGLPLGPHSIVAVYNGDDNFQNSTSGAFNEIVAGALTTLGITTSTSNTVWGQTVTISATPVAIGGGLVTGIITFYDGATQIGTGTFDGTDPLSVTLSNLSVGSHSITAVFGGNADFGGSTSQILSQVVAKGDTSVTLTTSATSLLPGAAVTLTAAIAVTAPALGDPTGTVNFYDGTTLVGTANLIDGVATVANATLPGGTHSITAAYQGDLDFNAVTGAASLVQVLLPGTIQFSAPTYTVNETSGTATITITRTAGSQGAIGSAYSVTGGTAVNGVDFTLANGTINFADGQSTATLTFPVSNDGKSGSDKTVVLTLARPTGGGILGLVSTATVTIHNDNVEPALSVNNPVVTEAPDGTGVAMFTITLSAPADVTVYVNYITEDGSTTAASGSYTPTSGQLIFLPGSTTQTVSVNINGTNTPGVDQTFNFGLANPVNATLGGGSGTATIINKNYANPTASNVGSTAIPGTTVLLNPLSTAHANDNGSLTLGILTQPMYGTASIVMVNGVQQLSYTPGRGAFESDSFTYQVTDSHGDVSSATAEINYQGIGLVVSPLNPQQTDLVIAGTDSSDSMKIAMSGKKIKVTLNGVNKGTFAPTGRIIAFTGAGNDVVTAAGVSKSVWLYAGSGNDTLTGGSSNDVLIGGTGKDTLNGGPGRNILIAGSGGHSTLKGGSTDILVAGSTIYDTPSAANQSALNTLLAQWIAHKKSVLPLAGATPDSPALDPSTITESDAGDILQGNKNSWFIGNFSYSGGTDTFADGRAAKKGHVLIPTASELVTNLNQ